jgi:hypothetical protein
VYLYQVGRVAVRVRSRGCAKEVYQGLLSVTFSSCGASREEASPCNGRDQSQYFGSPCETVTWLPITSLKMKGLTLTPQVNLAKVVTHKSGHRRITRGVIKANADTYVAPSNRTGSTELRFIEKCSEVNKLLDSLLQHAMLVRLLSGLGCCSRILTRFIGFP